MHKSKVIQNLEASTGSASITKDIFFEPASNKILGSVTKDKVSRIKTLINNAAQANESVDIFKQIINEYEQQEQTFDSRTAIARRTRICASWLAVVQLYKPEITIEDVFHYSIVKDHLMKFLPIMVSSLLSNGDKIIDRQ